MSSRHLQFSLSRVEKIDQKLRSIRAGVFVAIAFFAFMASRPAAPSVWTMLASSAIVAFIVLIVVHQRLKDRLKIWRGRVVLEGQIEALEMLAPRSGHLVFSDSEFKDSHLVRDLDGRDPLLPERHLSARSGKQRRGRIARRGDGRSPSGPL